MAAGISIDALARQKSDAAELMRLKEENNHRIASNLLNRNFHAVKGNCRDNAPMESFFSSLKTECVHRTRFKTFKQAKAALFDYIEVFYSSQRLHSTIGYKTPLEAFNEMSGQAT
jgi:transposase InsO family protein